MDIFRDLENALHHMSIAPPALENSHVKRSGATIATTYPARLPNHTLYYHYPALDLVSGGDAVHLPEPTDLDLRARPDPKNFQLDKYTLDYYCILHPNLTPEGIQSSEADPDVISLLVGIDALALQPGVTKLSIASFSTTDGSLKYRFRFEICIQGQTTFSDLELDDHQWSCLLQLRRPWIQLLADLVFRKSARAYIAVEESLFAQDIMLSHEDTLRWRDRWSSKGPQDAAHFARTQLQSWTLNQLDGTHTVEDRVIEVRMACGCVVQTELSKMYMLLDEKDESRLCIDCDNEVDWRELDQEVTSQQSSVVYPRCLMGVLLTVRKSLRVPEYITPRLLQPPHFEETMAALHTIESWTSTEDKVIEMTPQDLRTGLEGMVRNALVPSLNPNDAHDHFPPDWLTFLEMWLNRTVNFVFYRRCLESGQDHESLHVHEDDGRVWWVDPVLSKRSLADDMEMLVVD